MLRTLDGGTFVYGAILQRAVGGLLAADQATQRVILKDIDCSDTTIFYTALAGEIALRVVEIMIFGTIIIPLFYNPVKYIVGDRKAPLQGRITCPARMLG